MHARLDEVGAGFPAAPSEAGFPSQEEAAGHLWSGLWEGGARAQGMDSKSDRTWVDMDWLSMTTVVMVTHAVPGEQCSLRSTD